MKYYAEFETDKYIIEKYFSNKKDGIMVEVGAAMPESLSMSKAFKEIGWRIICVEPNPHYANLHRKAGNEIYEVALSYKEAENIEFDIYTSPAQEIDEGMSYSAIRGKTIVPGYLIPFKKTISVKVTTLNKILEWSKVDLLDFVSIDVEGWEIEVMKGFDTKKYNPLIILLENMNHSDFYNNYMKSIGYNLVHNIDYNFIYKKI